MKYINNDNFYSRFNKATHYKYPVGCLCIINEMPKHLVFLIGQFITPNKCDLCQASSLKEPLDIW